MFKFLTKKNTIDGNWLKVSDLKVGMQIAVPKDGVLDAHNAGQINSREWMGDDVLWDEIESIEYVGIEQVWDIEVEETHNFVGNNIFAHNTYIQNGNLGVGYDPTTISGGVAAFNGNVGIGTNAPNSQLQLTHDTTSMTTESDYAFSIKPSAGTAELLAGVNTTGGYSFIQSFAPGVTWSTKPLSLMPNGGSVGIGTTSPSQMLTVGNNNQFTVSSAGLVTGGTYNGQTISSAANFTGTVTTAGDININAAGGGLKLGANNWTDGGATYGHIISDNNVYKALMIVGNNIAGNDGLAREVKVWDFLNVQGTMNAITAIRTGAGAGTQRIDASGNLTNIGTITSGLINGQTISSAANFTGSLTTAGITQGSDIRSQAQIRATGWYGTNSGTYTGLGTEIGVSAGQGYILSYNRDTSAYGVLNLSATTINLTPQGGSVAISSPLSITGALTGVTTLTTSGAINGQTISSAANFTGTLNTVGAVTASQFNGSGAGLTANTVPIASLVAGDYSGKVTSGTYSINISGTAAVASAANFINSPDGDRLAGNKLPTTSGHGVRFDFAGAGSTGTGGNYAGVMTYAPWDGTTASTGDASYQLAFGSTAANGGGIPQLNIRKGIDSTWNSWYTILHSGNIATYAPSSIAGTANQITASASIGAVTLSVPSDFRAPGTLNAVTSISTGAGAGTQRIDASGNLTNIGTITSGLINGQTISSAANFTGTMTVATNVGIGLTSGVVSTLQVKHLSTDPNGSAVSSTVGGLMLSNASQGQSLIRSDHSTGAFYDGDTTFLNQFYNGSAYVWQERMRIRSDGNVGIGTTSPSFKLDVNGIVNATALYVNGTPYIGSQWTTSGSDISYNTGRVAVGTTTFATLAKLSMESTTSGTGSTYAIGGIFENNTFNPSAGGVQVGNRYVVNNAPTSVANTSVNEIVRTIDNTTLANTVRGIEVVSNAGSNTAGVNTGIRATGATFGVQAFSSGLAGGVSTPAAMYAESTGSTNGDVMRLYTSTMTSAANMANIYQEISTYTGTALGMNMGLGGGAFTGNFMNLQNAGVSKFIIDSTGKTGIGTSTLAAVQLTVAGDIRVGNSGTNGCIQGFGGATLTGICTSDMRLKTNIVDVGSGNSMSMLERLQGLRVINFNWNDTANSVYGDATTTLQTGYLAQNVESIFPELVSTSTEGFKQVNYSALGLYAIEGVKQLSIASTQASSTLFSLSGKVDIASSSIMTLSSGLTQASSSIITLAGELSTTFNQASSSIASLSNLVSFNATQASTTLASLLNTVNNNQIAEASSTANIISLINANVATFGSQISGITSKLNLANGKLNTMTFTSNGNVGIGNDGTSLGGELLRVSGSIRAQGFVVDSAADIAENFPASEAVDAGTVVAFGTSTVAWDVERGEVGSEQLAVGSNTNATSTTATSTASTAALPSSGTSSSVPQASTPSASSTASSNVYNLMSNVYQMSTVRKAVNGYEAVGVILHAQEFCSVER